MGVVRWKSGGEVDAFDVLEIEGVSCIGVKSYLSDSQLNFIFTQ